MLKLTNVKTALVFIFENAKWGEHCVSDNRVCDVCSTGQFDIGWEWWEEWVARVQLEFDRWMRGMVGLSPKKMESEAMHKKTKTQTLNRNETSHDRDSEESIRDAVMDQHGQRWIRYGTKEKAVWFSVPELLTSEKEVFSRLSQVAKPLLTAASHNEFKRRIENHSEYREALVASGQGWLDDIFVFADGTTSKNAIKEVIIAFDPNAGAARTGSLLNWKEGLAPVVANQAIPLTVLCAGLAGPLLRFLPPDYDTNLIVELVGSTFCGKSALAKGALSEWSDASAANTWDITPGGINRIKNRVRDGGVLLDETAVGSRKEMAQLVFKLSSSTMRVRWDTLVNEPSRFAAIITTNVRLANISSLEPEIRAALEDRIISIHVPEAGILSCIPPAFDSTVSAVEELIRITSENSGCVARTFISRLISRNLILWIPEVARIWRLCLQHRGGASPRKEKAFAVLLTVAFLARATRVFPSTWGDLEGAILKVFDAVAAKPSHTPDQIVGNYLRVHRGIVDLRDLGSPLDYREFHRHPGALKDGRDGRRWLLVPSLRFQKSVRDHERVVRALRHEEKAKTEGGSQKKLTIKAPRAYSATGRVYCLAVPEGAPIRSLESNPRKHANRPRSRH